MESLKTQNGDDAFNKLKELLLGTEIQTLRKLHDEVEEVRKSYEDPEEIAKRIRPVFNRIFADEITHNESELIELLSTHLHRIIEEATRNDRESLSEAIRPLAVPVLTKEVRDNHDKMTDVFYPILGGMIAKYVTQAIKEFTEKINRKLEEGLSVRAVKRKIKAKLTGVSESELLLEEGSDANLLALFVIHKPTGLLIASAQLEESVINDAHMVAAMASALKDFLNDSFDFKSQMKEEVQIVSYGDATLYIESAGSVYLIAFLDGEPDYEQRSGINSFFAWLVRHYAPFFQSFDGNENAPEVAQLTQRLEEYLDAVHRGSFDGEKKSAMLFWVALLLLVPLLAWFGYDRWKQYRFERMADELQRIGVRQLSIDEINATAYRLHGIVDRVDTAMKAKRRLMQMTGAKTVIDDLVPSVATFGALQKADRTLKTSYARIDTDVDRLRRENETLRQTYAKAIAQYQAQVSQLTQRLDDLEKRYRMLDRQIHLPNVIKRDLDAVMERSPYYEVKTGRLNFAALHPFAPMQTTIRPEALPIFRQTIQRYLAVLCRYHDAIERIEVGVFSDTDGNAAKNRLLTQQRAEGIVGMIGDDEALHQCFDTTRFVAEGYGESRPIIIDGVEDKNASRRIEVFYKLKPLF